MHKHILRRAVAAAALIPAAAAGVVASSAATAGAARPICPDSNGSAPGGSVYLYYGQASYYCDVVPPQRLHYLQTPSAAVCADHGGHGWTAAYRICWDVDY